MSDSLLHQGNRAFEEKNYEMAILFYTRLKESTPAMGKLLQANIDLAYRRIEKSSQNSLDGNNDVFLVKNEIDLKIDFLKKSQYNFVHNKNKIHEEKLIIEIQSYSLKKVIDIISSSGFFDKQWYLAEYRDVASKPNVDPTSHFARNGGRENRNPSPLFNTLWYKKMYPEVLDTDLNPLLHYLLVGIDKGYHPTDQEKSLSTWWLDFANSWYDNFNAYDVVKRIASNQSPVAIVIPVYNALSELMVCVDSVLMHTKINYRLLIINDASTDVEVKKYLDRLLGVGNIEIYHNSKNLGFTSTVNRGLKLAGISDVVLLNSDTKVTSNWLVNLKFAAYSSERVGTATPFSNNAGAYSSPNIGKENFIPEGYSLNDWARAINQTVPRKYISAPTGHGFCMYIRNDCLVDVGLLDQDAFPRGYGEENDFCMRAIKKNWSNIVDQSTYIYHVRSASFGSEKNELLKKGRSVIDERYPEYTNAVRSFVTNESLISIHKEISKVELLLLKDRIKIKPRVLYVLSTKTGGTPQTNQDLMHSLRFRIESFVIYSNNKKIELYYFDNNNYYLLETFILRDNISVFPHRSVEYDELFSKIIFKYSIELVHVRHIAWHSFGLIDVAKLIGIPVVFSFHDFYTVCPTVKLIDGDLNYCGGKCTKGDTVCRYELWTGADLPLLRNAGVISWRDEFKTIFYKCNAFITTSQSAKNIIIDTYTNIKNNNFHVIPHGRDFESFDVISKNISPNQILRLIVPGNISEAKGGGVIEKLSKKFSRKEVEIHILGNVAGNLDFSNCILHGNYRREDFSKLVKSIDPHVGCVFSIWPETYCHTLTELWASGIPVIGFDIGAVGDRLRQTGAGWLVKDFNEQAVINILDSIKNIPGFYKHAVESVTLWQKNHARQESCDNMGSLYFDIYKKLISVE